MKLAMKQLKAILRLRAQGLSLNAIAKQLKISTSTVQKYFRRQDEAKITWEIGRSMSEADLELALQPQRRKTLDYAEPDWTSIYLASKKKSAPTLQSQWLSYKAKTLAEGGKPLGYSAFARNFSSFKAALPGELAEYASIFEYKPGEIVEIDYSGGGHGVCVTFPETGVIQEAQIFVAVLPYSNLTFFYATRGQTRDDWLDALTKMMEYFGGVPNYIDLDNSTSLVIKASKYSPKCCNEFIAFCAHYGTTPFPVRPNEPRDKAHVEGAVGLCQRKVLSVLKTMKFFSFDMLNKELRRYCDEFNKRPLCNQVEESRRSLFESEEVAFLNPLPSEPWEPSMITKKLKVRNGGIIRYEDRRYRVPYQAIGTKVLVQVFPRRGQLVIRTLGGRKLVDYAINGDGGVTSRSDLMPPAAKYVYESNEDKIERLSKAGPFSKQMAKAVGTGYAKRVAHKRLMGLQDYLNRLGDELFEKCSKAAVTDGVLEYDNAERYYRNELKGRPVEKRLPKGAKMESQAPIRNVRGPEAYRDSKEETGS